MKQRPQGLDSSSHLISSISMVTADKQALLFTVILEPLSNFMRKILANFQHRRRSCLGKWPPTSACNDLIGR